MGVTISAEARAARFIDGKRPISVDQFSFGCPVGCYTGGRFGTKTEVPPVFLDQAAGEPTSDGRRRAFHLEDGAKLQIFGAPAGSLSAERKRLLAQAETKELYVTYKVDRKGELVFSGFKDRERASIFYSKVIEGCGAVHGIEVEYPVSKRSMYDPAVARMAKSLRCRLGPRSHRLWRPGDRRS